MTEKYTLGIDIGTTGVKTSVLDVDAGKVVAHSLKEHPLFHPKPGYAEQEGDNYWKAVVAAVKECFKQGSFADFHLQDSAKAAKNLNFSLFILKNRIFIFANKSS